ncbi:unnamed protein product [Timema podura]|uniref:Uncharacterized protein n=1 Tax=Timema podura TaxID=61482 RepID=A0ABN7P0P2_TIMPD|nr:unnamed protein product [Timema podura]
MMTPINSEENLHPPQEDRETTGLSTNISKIENVVSKGHQPLCELDAGLDVNDCPGPGTTTEATRTTVLDHNNLDWDGITANDEDEEDDDDTLFLELDHDSSTLFMDIEE